METGVKGPFSNLNFLYGSKHMTEIYIYRQNGSSGQSLAVVPLSDGNARCVRCVNVLFLFGPPTNRLGGERFESQSAARVPSPHLFGHRVWKYRSTPQHTTSEVASEPGYGPNDTWRLPGPGEKHEQSARGRGGPTLRPQWSHDSSLSRVIGRSRTRMPVA